MKKILNILAFIALPAWIWLFIHDWKVALALFIIMFGNNLMIKADKS